MNFVKIAALVDRDPLRLDLNEEILQSAGYLVVRFSRYSDLHDGLNFFGRDVIISTIDLNDTESEEMLGQIKLNPSTSGIPLIIIGTYPSEHNKAYEIGASRFIFTPYHADELLAAVKSSACDLSIRHLNT